MITDEQFDVIFKEQVGVKGIPGTKMENYAQDFIAFVKKLNSHKDVMITHLLVGYPNNTGDK